MGSVTIPDNGNNGDVHGGHGRGWLQYNERGLYLLINLLYVLYLSILAN